MPKVDAKDFDKTTNSPATHSDISLTSYPTQEQAPPRMRARRKRAASEPTSYSTQAQAPPHMRTRRKRAASAPTSYSTQVQSPPLLHNQVIEQQTTSSPVISAVLLIIGILVFLAGFALAYGNVSGRFPTFDYAGSLLMVIGVGITKLADIV